MKQEIETHAAELQHLADKVTEAQLAPSRKKREKLLATLGPALQSAAEKAKRLGALYKQQDQVIGDAKRSAHELRTVLDLPEQVQALSTAAAEPKA